MAAECTETLCTARELVQHFQLWWHLYCTIPQPAPQCPHPTSAHWSSHLSQVCFISCLRGVVLIPRWARRNVLNEQHVSSGQTWFIIHAVDWVVQQQCCWEFTERYYAKDLSSSWIIDCRGSYGAHWNVSSGSVDTWDWALCSAYRTCRTVTFEHTTYNICCSTEDEMSLLTDVSSDASLKLER